MESFQYINQRRNLKMKHKIIMLMLLISSMAFGAREGVVVDSDGRLTRPNASTFARQNNLVSNEVICIRVDMFRGGVDDTLSKRAFYWSDAELKVLDVNGNLLYFATTSYNDVVNYHSDDGTWDANCRIYYYIAGTKYAADGQCSNPKQRHTVSASQSQSIGKKEGISSSTNISGSQNHPITAVEFFPNLSGTINGMSVREIFLNPENTIIVSRKNQNELERTGNGARVWRPTIPQYYRK